MFAAAVADVSDDKQHEDAACYQPSFADTVIPVCLIVFSFVSQSLATLYSYRVVQKDVSYHSFIRYLPDFMILLLATQQ